MAKIVLVILDSLRADALGCYGGSASTPYIDELANQGTIFKSAISQGASSEISIYSLLTGKYPHNHGYCPIYYYRNLTNKVMIDGVARIVNSIHSHVETIFDVLTKHNYACAAYLDKWNQPGYTFPNWNKQSGNNYNEWLFDHAKDDFFLLIHSFETHIPWLWKDGVKSARIYSHLPICLQDRKPTTEEWEKICLTTADNLLNSGPDQVCDALNEAVKNTDKNIIGKLTRAAKYCGIYDDVVWIICSDHGDMLWDAVGNLPVKEHFGYISHNFNIYEPIINVPLIIKTSLKLKQPRQIVSHVAIVDVFPTLLDICGINVDYPIDGVSLISLMSHSQAAAAIEINRRILSFSGRRLFGLRDNEWKYIYDLDNEESFLFQISGVCNEYDNVIDGYPDKKDEYEGILCNLLRVPSLKKLCMVDNRIERCLRLIGFLHDLNNAEYDVIDCPELLNILRKDIEIYMNKQHKLYSTQDFTENIRLQLTMFPGDDLSAYQKASILSLLRQYGEAEDIFMNLAIKPGIEPKLKSGALYHLGMIRLNLGCNGEAKDYFQACLENDPSHRKAKARLIDIVGKEFFSLEGLVEIIDVLLSEGRESLFSNDYVGAIKKFRRAECYFPEHLGVHYWLAIACFRTGDYAEAQRNCLFIKQSKCADKHLYELEARLIISLILTLEGRASEGRSELDSILTIRPFI